MEDHILMAGSRRHSELAEWYNAADVFCLASEMEGWPNVLLEAMACGLPVISTNVGSASEIVTCEDFGLLVGRNSEAFQDAIDKALSRQWDTDSIVSHARSHGWD